jgi:exodeoxyribonuclease V beta subunit
MTVAGAPTPDTGSTGQATPVLDPLNLPLAGCQLIEASAGTGKTWTIAALMLRLVLGHGVTARMPAEVLVMTFTRAATRELAQRIRERLAEAAAVFRLPPGAEGDIAARDPFFGALLGAHPAGAAREHAAWRLTAAARAMDEAAVLTLDAWCQRMLREHAFDAGGMPDDELLPDLGALQREAALDYWRQQVYPLIEPARTAVLHLWPQADALRAFVRGAGEPDVDDAAPMASLADVAGTAMQALSSILAGIKSGWPERVVRMRGWLEPLMEPGRSPFKANIVKPEGVRGWLDAMAAWAADPAARVPELAERALHRLTPAGLQEALKKGQTCSPPPDFDAVDALRIALQDLPDPSPAIRRHALAGVARRMAELQARSRQLGFADMLRRLDDALDERRHGARAQRLRARIVGQFPVAVVDEFQDTSPLQWRILERLYRPAGGAAEPVLLLIGDPKQAIYSFRGADIRSYLQARTATAGRHHRLATNFRSTVPLVASVNGLFDVAQRRGGTGVFELPAVDGQAAGSLAYEAVQAHGRAERWCVAGAEPAPLTLCVDTELRSADESMALMASRAADRIVRWLGDPATGFDHPQRGFTRLRPADVAVLVRTGRQAQAMRQALRRRGVASVYLSDRDSVLASAEAADVLRLLQAIESPRDIALARAAFATALMGLTLDELRVLAEDDEAFDARCEVLLQLQQVWRRRGVLAVVRQALHRLGLPARWMAAQPTSGSRPGEGERRLTNVLHLGELLQTHAPVLDGEAAVVRWLAQAIDEATEPDGAAPAEEHLLRLESDADLVKVVTVHKSKGLEYPLVCLPFAAHRRSAASGAARSHVLRLPRAGGGRRLVLEPDDADLALADAERLAEDMRMLYVALTRARHGVWVGLSALRAGQGRSCVWHESAIGRLLSGAQPIEAEQLLAQVQAMASQVPGVAVEVADATPLPSQAAALVAAADALPLLRPARAYRASFDRNWSVGSYTALVRDAQAAVEAWGEGVDAVAVASDSPSTEPDVTATDDTGREGAAQVVLGLPIRLREDEAREVTVAAGAAEPGPAGDSGASATDVAPWHGFPRGALPGNFLHDQLEWLAGEGFALGRDATLVRVLERRCARAGWGHRSDDVSQWLQRVCGTPLDALRAGGGGPGVALSALQGTAAELEFWLPSAGLRAAEVDALCRRHILPGRERPVLAARTLHGMLMGFIDLAYEHDGRYGVLDYKSNALGTSDAAYAPHALAAALLKHRYDVQAALYQMALHRLLRSRLGSTYVPERHLHGAVVWFLRGVAAPGQGAVWLPPVVDLIEALDAMLAARSPAGSEQA